MKLPLVAVIIALTLAACSTTLPPNTQRLKGPGEWVITPDGAVPVRPGEGFNNTVKNPPTSMSVEWSHVLPKATGNHWVVFRVKLDPSTGEVTDMDAAQANDAIDCLNKAHLLSPSRAFTKNALPYAEIRVCRQLAADGSPLDEDKIDENGKVLPQDRGDPQQKKDNTV